MLTIIEEAAKRVGGVPELARRLGVTRQAIYQWHEVPLERVADLAATTGLPKENFRPDVFKIESYYESDFHHWAEQQAELMATGRLNELDIINLTEEIKDMSRRLRNSISSHLTIVAFHMLKWRFQPRRRSKSWTDSIRAARARIEDIIDDNPSLKGYPEEVFAKAYGRARRDAAGETGLPIGTFPETSPFTIRQLLGHDPLTEDGA